MRCDRLVIVNDFSVARGGATALALLSAELIRARNIPVTLFCGDVADNLDLNRNGVEVVSVGGKPLLDLSRRQAMTSGMFNSQAKVALENLIARRDTPNTIYHVHAWSLILSPSIFQALKSVASRVVIHSHDQFLACPNGVYYDFKKGESCSRKPLSIQCVTTNCDKRSFAHKGWRVMRHAVLAGTFNDKTSWGAIVLIHADLEPRLKRFGYANSKMVTIRNPVEPFSLQRVCAEKNKDFFFVGRVEPDKGVLEFAHAAKLAGVPVRVIGEGPLCKRLQDSFPDIRQEGWCDKQTIGRHIQQARALVMPSRFAEPFGLVAVEAIRSGVPVIVAEDTFLANEIVSAGFGFACNIHSPKAFSKALHKMKHLPETEVRRMSECGFANAHSLALDPEKWCDDLLELYDRTLAAAE